jgi:putative transcriptional regulator
MSLRISYKPLRVLLVEKDISRQQLIDGAGINKNTAGKLFKDIEVSLSTLMQVCEYLDCGVSDAVEFVPDYVRDEKGLIKLYPTELGAQIMDRVKHKKSD